MTGASSSGHLADGWTVYAPVHAPVILRALHVLRRDRRRCGSDLTAHEIAALEVAERAAGAAAARFVSETARPATEQEPPAFVVAGDVTVSEAAAALSLSEQYVRRLAADGRLAARRVGRSWAIDAATVAALRLARGSDGGGQAGLAGGA